jgi:hypothetical protein
MSAPSAVGSFTESVIIRQNRLLQCQICWWCRFELNFFGIGREGGKIDGMVTRRIQNNCKLYKIINRYDIMDERDPKKKNRKKICKIYFKLIPTFISERWTLTKRKCSKIQVMNMNFQRHVEGKAIRDRIRN